MKRTMVSVFVVGVALLGAAWCLAAERGAAIGAAREKANAQRDAAKENRGAAREKREAAKEKVQERREELEKKAEQRVDQRQDNQAKRIQHGIDKGYLTADEIAKLDAQQKEITGLEASFKSDGKLNRSEFSQLREAINVASANIWAEKHDTDGNQMPAYRFGKNVFAKGALTQQLANDNLTGAEAKALTKDFNRMLELKRKLATEDLSANDRAKLQAEFDALLNRYFEVR